jgi:F-type H+-transporting ATPase subunit b
MTVLSAVLLAAPVVDIDGTIFIQGGIFLGLMFVLQQLLFKPWLEVQERRAEKIDGAFALADKLEAQAGDKESQYAADLAAARDKATATRSAVRKESEAEGEKLLTAARQEAGETLAREKARLGDEADKARAALDARIDELANNITAKVLGRSA